MKKYIHGPINVVRLEGNILDTKKIVYLFCDIVDPFYFPKMCEDVAATQMTHYIAKNIKSSSNKIDLFAENNQQQINLVYYSSQMKKLISTLMKHDNKLNLRLHISDLSVFDKNYLFNSLYHIRNYENSKIYFDILNSFGDKIVTILKIMNGSNIENSDPDFEEIKKIFQNIQNKYNHLEIKNVLLDYLNNYRKLMNKILVRTDENVNSESMKKYITNKNKLTLYDYKIIEHYDYSHNLMQKMNINNYILNQLYQLHISYLNACYMLDEIFFLRRFLDKNYITHAVKYLGISSFIRIISCLIKNFDFKITHVSYSKISDREITSYIKIAKNLEIHEVLLPPYLVNCSDITNFPESFQ